MSGNAACMGGMRCIQNFGQKAKEYVNDLDVGVG